MIISFKQDLRESADFIRENYGAFIDFLGFKSYEEPDDRAKEILENLGTASYKVFAVKNKLHVLFTLIELQHFESEAGKLCEFEAYVDLKDLVKSL